MRAKFVAEKYIFYPLNFIDDTPGGMLDYILLPLLSGMTPAAS